MDAKLEVRPSRLKLIVSHVMFSLFLLFCWLWDTPEHPGAMSWFVYPGLIAVMALLAAWHFFDTEPRLIIAVDGLSWREKKKEAFSFLTWDEIVSADIREGGEDTPRCLRLKLPSPPALEKVASDLKGGRKVDIPIEGLDLSDRQLMVAIHRRAPHLFSRVSYRAT